MDDVYGDLDNYNDANVVEELRNENIELKQKINDYDSAMQKLQRDFDELATEFKKLEMNYTSLLKTARAEIERKTQTITNLNIEKDAMVLNAIQNQSYGAYRRCISSRLDAQSNDSRICKKATTGYKTMNHEQSKLVEGKKLGVSSSKQDSVPSDNRSKNISDYTIPKVTENTKPCSLRSRRKSMSALRSENRLESDDEYNQISNEKRYEKRTPGSYGENRQSRSRHRSCKGSGSSAEDKYSSYKESSLETFYRSRDRYDYENRKKRHRYDLDRQPNYSPDRYRKGTRQYQYNEYRHSDKESRYTHQSRNHDQRTYDSNYDRDYYEGYKHKNYSEEDCNENRSKRIKYNHTPSYPDERVFQQETLHTDEELLQKVIGDMPYTSCQSPDMITDHPPHFIPEIKLNAEEELEDPRLKSRKYTLKTKEDKVILSTVDSKVDLKKFHWNIQHVMLPDALLYPPRVQDVAESIEVCNTKTKDNSNALLAQDHNKSSSSACIKHNINVKHKPIPPPTQIEVTPIPFDKYKSTTKNTEYSDVQDYTNILKSNVSCIKDNLNMKHKAIHLPVAIEPLDQYKSTTKTTENSEGLLDKLSNTLKSSTGNNRDTHNVKQKTNSLPTQIDSTQIPLDQCESRTKTTENSKLLLAQDNANVSKSNQKDNQNLKQKTVLPLPTKVESIPNEQTKSSKLIVQNKTSNVITPKASKMSLNKQLDNIVSIQTAVSTSFNVETKSIYDNLDAPQLNMSMEEGEIADLLLIGLDSNKMYNTVKVQREPANVIESKNKQVQDRTSLEINEEENKKKIEVEARVLDNITKKSTKITSSQDTSNSENITNKSNSSDKIKKSNREIVAGDLELSDETNDNQDFQKHFLKQPNKEEDSKEPKEHIPEVDIKVIRILSPDEDKSKGKRKVNKTKLSSKKICKTNEAKSENKVKDKKSNNKISTPIKNKFSDLFGDSSSLITPEDLGMEPMQVINNYEPIIEDAQDALDVKFNSEPKPVTIEVQEENVKTKDRNVQTCNDKIKPVESQLCNEDLLTQKTNVIVHSIPFTQESDVVKTVIISTGTQPQFTNVPNAIGIQNNSVDNNLIALATSTPHKSITVPSIKLPDDSCNSNDSRSSSNAHSVTSLIQSDDVPDVRLFIKRKKRRVIKKA